MKHNKTFRIANKTHSKKKRFTEKNTSLFEETVGEDDGTIPERRTSVGIEARCAVSGEATRAAHLLRSENITSKQTLSLCIVQNGKNQTKRKPFY